MHDSLATIHKFPQERERHVEKLIDRFLGESSFPVNLTLECSFWHARFAISSIGRVNGAGTRKSWHAWRPCAAFKLCFAQFSRRNSFEWVWKRAGW